ncbi:regulation of nuclear pre-mRNA domain-containing protein 1B-like [Paramacrobiotus metropolitanus]|uniref:regulation of nuclear pre-mRNA domain-containing protein 1B-like n=1 Tax=Paramacrobiotus metropolitanus TaxID=2943436 RepID=UPI002445E3FD|nr:regulation of nuclear pre-mRNA domain-containing protein 1B-like [Paramacrobiotus metropolitanus]
MTAFTEGAFKSKLKDLNNTQQSIQTISLWAIHHRKHHAKMVNIWMDEVREAKEASRKLTLLYFANDVIQNMRKKGPEFHGEFRNALPEAVDSAVKTAKGEGDEKVAKSLSRLVSVWRERAIFDEPFVKRLDEIIAGTASASPPKPIVSASKTVNINNDLASPTPMTKTPSTEPASLPKRIKIEADFQAFAVKKNEPPRAPEPLDSDDEEYEEVKLTGDEETPKLETLLRLIQKLQNAPSANADIRSKIAELPAIITDPNAIDKLSDREEVDRLVSVAKDGLEMVINYNKDLNAELQDRQAVALELARQLAFHRKIIEEKEKIREELGIEISRRRVFRDKLHIHVESLPDMSSISSSSSRSSNLSFHGGLSSSRTSSASSSKAFPLKSSYLT